MGNKIFFTIIIRSAVIFCNKKQLFLMEKKFPLTILNFFVILEWIASKI